MRRIRAAVAEAARVLVPFSCLGCGADGGPLCPTCTARLGSESVLVERAIDVDGTALRVVSAANYGSVVRELIVAVKERQRRSAARYLAPLLTAALRELLRDRGGSAGSILLVTPPSSYRRRVARGFDPVRLIARHAGASPARLVRRRRRAVDQVGLGRGGRQRNLRDAFGARRSLSGVVVVLIDDIVTSGSTLRELTRAIRAAGGEVVGAATVASTPLRGVPRRRGTAAHDPRKVLNGNAR